MKIKLITLFLFLVIKLSCSQFPPSCIGEHGRFCTKPVLVQPQCDPFTSPVCITSPREGQKFVTDQCLTGCALCYCNNSTTCAQRVLSKLTVTGTTKEPGQVVTVVLINDKLTSGDTDNTMELATSSTPAPNGTGVWSVSFTLQPGNIGGIPTPKPPPFKQDAIPTIISVSVNTQFGWFVNFASRSIYIKKDMDCPKTTGIQGDCDLVCRKHQCVLNLCKLHIYDKLTDKVKNKYK